MATKAADCPRCRTPLTRTRRFGVPAGACDACHGLWLDRGGLAKAVEKRTPFGEEELKRIAELRSRAHARRDDPRAPCPTCGRMMERVRYRKTRISLDRCLPHGIWFDEGELERAQLVAEKLAPRGAIRPACSRCGAPLRRGAAECDNCGARIGTPPKGGSPVSWTCRCGKPGIPGRLVRCPGCGADAPKRTALSGRVLSTGRKVGPGFDGSDLGGILGALALGGFTADV